MYVYLCVCMCMYVCVCMYVYMQAVAAVGVTVLAVTHNAHVPAEPMTTRDIFPADEFRQLVDAEVKKRAELSKMFRRSR